MKRVSRFIAPLLTACAITLTIANPPAAAKQHKQIRLNLLSSFDSGIGEGGAEIAALDSANHLLLVTNGAENRIDIFPIFGGEAASFDISPYGGGVQRVAVKDGLAVAVAAADPVVLPGKAVFFDPANPDAGGTAIVVGALPDMVTFSYQGTKVLVANEGEPRCIDADGFGVTDPSQAINPEGTISIIDLVSGQPGPVTTVDFKAFNDSATELRSDGVRIGTWPSASVAEDLEPEYITVAKNGKAAYVSLQENNAVAVIDLESGGVLDIVGLERSGGIMSFDVTDPTAPELLEWAQTGDISPEGMQFIKQEDSPTGTPLLVVSYEVSGTTAIFEIVK